MTSRCANFWRRSAFPPKGRRRRRRLPRRPRTHGRPSSSATRPGRYQSSRGNPPSANTPNRRQCRPPASRLAPPAPVAIEQIENPHLGDLKTPDMPEFKTKASSVSAIPYETGTSLPISAAEVAAAKIDAAAAPRRSRARAACLDGRAPQRLSSARNPRHASGLAKSGIHS